MMESKNILLDLLKEKYDYERERRRYYDEGLNIPVAILTLIIGGTYTLLTNDSIEKVSFSSACVIAILVLAVVSLFYLWRTYFGYNRRYCSFPDSNTVINRYTALKLYHKKNTGIECEENDLINKHFKEDLEEDIIEYYRDINSNNITVNDLRGDSLHKAKMYIGFSICLAILLFLLEYIKLLT